MTVGAAAGQGRLVAWSRMREGVARRMAESKQQAPHFYMSVQVVMDEALRVRRAAQGEAISLTSLLVCATASALREFPRFNAVWTPAGLLEADDVNVGVAIALEEGLLAPALLRCDAMTIHELSAALDDLVARARSGKLKPEEISEATFTVSNLGMYPVSAFAAIVNPPQVAILATGTCLPQLRLVDGAVQEAQVLTLTLSADHRAIDGADGARFLASIKARLEDPATIRGVAAR